MARSSSKRRHGRPAARTRPAPARLAPRARAAPSRPVPWWRARWRAVLVVLGLLVAAVGLGVAGALLHQPPRPDAGTVHAAVLAGRSGTEVTFNGTVESDPTSDGGHERMLVRDELGDTLELDYNVTLGRTVPVRRGDVIEVHGQLYVDPGQAGVHCLHGQTSRGCPQPGWIQFAGTTYS